jgi:hypothetical protein
MESVEAAKADQGLVRSSKPPAPLPVALDPSTLGEDEKVDEVEGSPVREIEDAVVWEVRGRQRGRRDGAIYLVVHSSSEKLWYCTCPAGIHGRLCYHLALVKDQALPG